MILESGIANKKDALDRLFNFKCNIGDLFLKVVNSCISHRKFNCVTWSWFPCELALFLASAPSAFFLYSSQHNPTMKRRYTISDNEPHQSKLSHTATTTGVRANRLASNDPKMPRLSAPHHSSHSLGPQRIEVATTTPAEGRTKRSVAIKDPWVSIASRAMGRAIVVCA